MSLTPSPRLVRHRQHRQLSPKVLVFHAAQAPGVDLCTVFVLEIAMLLKVGRIALQEPYGDWAEHLLAQPGFVLPRSTSACSLKRTIIRFPIPSIA
jgi:hypothetical protein